MSPYSRNQGTWQRLFRIKRRHDKCFVFPESATPQTTYELINVGLHAVLGVGVFVGVGQIIKDFAGPSILLSLVVAATTCLLSGLCYTELCVRCPEREGGSYTYLYYAAGELVAWICACCTITQNVFAVALSGRAISQNFDFLLNNAIANATATSVGYIQNLDACPDFVSLVVVFVITAQVALGIKTSNSLIKLICNGITVIIVVLISSFGMFSVDIRNWTDVKDFFPYQLQGVFVGAALCCFFLLGLDSLLSVTTSHVCRKQPFQSPSKSVFTLHISLLSTLTITMVVCVSVSVILSLIVDTSTLVTESPLAEGLDSAGVKWLRYIYFIGVTAALGPFACKCLVQTGELFHVLSSDGLVPGYVGECSERAGVPLAVVVVHGIISAVCGVIFNLSELLSVVVLSILVVQTLACVSLTVLRYQPRRTYQPNTKKLRHKRRKKRKAENRNSALRNDLHLIQRTAIDNMQNMSNPTQTHEQQQQQQQQQRDEGNNEFHGTLQLRLDFEDEQSNADENSNSCMTAADSSSDTDIDDIVDEYKETLMVATSTGSVSTTDTPNPISAKRACWCACGILIVVTVLSAVLIHAHRYLMVGSPAVITVLCVCVSLLLALVVFLALQPREDWGLDQLQMYVPFVPWIPTIAMLLTTHLLLRFSLIPWIIFLIFLTLGLSFYFTFGIRNSMQVSSYEPVNSEERVLLDSADDDSVTIVNNTSGFEPATDSATPRRVEQVDVLIIE